MEGTCKLRSWCIESPVPAQFKQPPRIERLADKHCLTAQATKQEPQASSGRPQKWLMGQLATEHETYQHASCFATHRPLGPLKRHTQAPRNVINTIEVPSELVVPVQLCVHELFQALADLFCVTKEHVGMILRELSSLFPFLGVGLNTVDL